MEKIITLDKNVRIKIISENFMLQYKIKTRNEIMKWATDGFFPDLKSLYEEYLSNTPRRTIQTTKDFKKLIETIKTAELNSRKTIEKNIQKIIPIGKDARIKVTTRNHILQYKIKTGNKQIAWHTDGFFPDLKSLSKGYLNNAPHRANQIIDNFEKLIKVIKTAELNFCKAIKKNE